jgi:hypothetical protein
MSYALQHYILLPTMTSLTTTSGQDQPYETPSSFDLKYFEQLDRRQEEELEDHRVIGCIHCDMAS